MTAADMVQALTDALNRRHSKKTGQLDCPPSAYVSAVLVPEGGPVKVRAMGEEEGRSRVGDEGARVALPRALPPLALPQVDERALRALGVQHVHHVAAAPRREHPCALPVFVWLDRPSQGRAAHPR